MPLRMRWRGLELPVRVSIDHQALSDRYGEFVAEPFERGFGHSLGNSLRRVLLSSLEGTAVVAARIGGVEQEFTTIPGVLEDVSEIMLNIKQLVLRLHPDEEHSIRIAVKRKGAVTGADIEDDPDVEVVNPEHKIATLTDKVQFVCEMLVRKGRGYVPSEEHEGLPHEIGLIHLDSLFSPVQRVAYSVEDTRVGRKTNYDRLHLKIWTNGSVSPEMALVEAAKILRKHLNPFVEYFELGRELPADKRKPLSSVKHLDQPKVTESKLTMPLKALNLNVRANHCLETEGIKTLGDLLQRPEEELLQLRNFGEVTLAQVREKVAEHGLELGILAPPAEEEGEQEGAEETEE